MRRRGLTAWKLVVALVVAAAALVYARINMTGYAHVAQPATVHTTAGALGLSVPTTIPAPAAPVPPSFGTPAASAEMRQIAPPAALPSLLQAPAEVAEVRPKLPPAGRVTFRSERISIQSAVAELCAQAHVAYDWQRSNKNTQPDCRRYVKVEVTNLPLEEALDLVVTRNGLHFATDERSVWLER